MVGKNRLQPAPEKARSKLAAAKHRVSEDAALASGVASSALQLQATAGNRAVQRLVQREVEDEQGSPDLFNVPGVTLPAPGGGRSLPDELRSDMEQSFDQSFDDVRVHEDSSPDSVGALAYTQGSDIHFSPGQYKPDSESGRAIVGHELTHVVQQRAGRVASPKGSGAPVNADPSLEEEADRLGASAARGGFVSASGTGSGVQRAVKPVQRNGGDPPGGDGGGQQIDPDKFKSLMTFWKAKDAGTATQTEVAVATPEVAAYVASPAPTESLTPTAEEQSGMDSAIKAAEKDPEGVMEDAGISQTEVQSAETEQQEKISAEVKPPSPSAGPTESTTSDAPELAEPAKPSGGAKLKDADAETQQDVKKQLDPTMLMAGQLLGMLSQTATMLETGATAEQVKNFEPEEVVEVVAHEEEERAEERIETGMEQVGLVVAGGEGYGEVGPGGAVAQGATVVGAASTLWSVYKSVKDGLETLKDDSLDMQMRVDAVAQITAAVGDVGSVTASLTELIGEWAGRSKAFQDAAGNWGAAFGIVTGGIAMVRSGVSGGLAHHRIKKLKAIKERRGEESGEQSEQIAEAAGEAIDTNKARRTNAVVNFTKGGVTLAAGILALAGAGPVGWGIAAGVGLVSALWAGYKWWKRKNQDPNIRKEELFKQLQVAKLIAKGIRITDADIAADSRLEQVREDYRQIALKLGAPKKKVMNGSISAKNLAKLMSRH